MQLRNLAPIPELYVSYESAQKLKVEAADLISWDMTPRQICDLELLMNGGFNPLKGFLSEEDYDGVVENMRTADGALWPIPITLDVSEKFADTIEVGQDIALRDQEGVILAMMSVTDKWVPNKAREAEKVFGADDSAHPAVNYLHNQAGNVYLGGPITGIQPPVHYDFRARRDTPNELRAYFRKLGWRRVVAFQTRNPSAPRPSGTDLPRRKRSPGQPADPPGRRPDQARGCRPFHPCSLLRGGAGQISDLDDQPCRC